VTDEKEKRLNASRIAHSFSRSRSRRDIHLYLCGAFPDGKSKEEISASTGYDEETIIGALVGNEGRYRPEDALITLGLAAMREEEYHGQKITMYTSTSDGKEVEELLKNYAQNISLLEKIKEYVNKLEIRLKEKKQRRG
jgi:predicted transcriptional regulator with HTH domain